MGSSDQLRGRMSDTNGDLCSVHFSQTGDYRQGLYFQKESDLLVPSSRYQDLFPLKENFDCGVWPSCDVDMSLSGHSLEDAHLWSRFSRDMSCALSPLTCCRHHVVVESNGMDKADALQSSCCCWESPNCTSCQSADNCCDLHPNCKMDATLRRHHEKDGIRCSTVSCDSKTPHTDARAVDITQKLSPNSAPQAKQIRRFQSDCQNSNKNNYSRAIADEAKDKPVAINLEGIGQTETTSDDHSPVDYRRQDGDLGIGKCLTVDGSAPNEHESFHERNCSYQIEGRIHRNKGRSRHNGDVNLQTKDRSHQAADGRPQTGDGEHPTRDDNHLTEDGDQNEAGNRPTGNGGHQPGDGDCQTGDGSHQTEDGSHQTGGGSHQTGGESHQTGDGNHQTGGGNHQTGDESHQTGEMNVNNHKIPCLPMKKKLNQDLLRLTEENFCLCAQNHELRQNIRCVRKSTVDECSKVLDTIISFCECHSNCKPESRTMRAACCVDTDRIGAGCSSGGCGGYTPSGWNRLLTLHSLECDDPCCFVRCPPPPPCTCSCVEDEDGTCCTCCVKEKPRRKRKCCVFTCDPKTADENESAMQNRLSAKILGELAFQIERRILDYVFGLEGSKRRRFYGYTVNNIHQMIEKESKTYKGEEDPVRKAELELRLSKLLQGLKQAGYNVKIHGDFAQQMINRYGLLSCSPDSGTVEDFGLQNASCISKLIPQLARGEHEANKFQVLLRALQYLSKLDSAPLFIW